MSIEYPLFLDPQSHYGGGGGGLCFRFKQKQATLK